jgi:hypothetical protein
MNRRDLEQHVQDLFEGLLDPRQLLALERELAADPEAREAYLDYAELHNALQLRAEGIDLLQVVPMERIVERRQRRVRRTSAMATAAVLLIGAVAMSFVLTRGPEPSLRFATSPGTELTIHHDLAGGTVPAGQGLEPGSRLMVGQGTVELKFTSGVRGIIRGPADLTLQREDLIEMNHGTAWFEVPADEAGFKVSTPALVLTDLGTEFGIRSRAGFLDEVHVFSGRVEILARRGLRKREELSAGQARVSDPAGRWQAIPIRPEDFSTRLPSTPPDPPVIVTEDFKIGNELAYADAVSASDLLHGLTPATSGWNFNNHASPLELTDGIHGATYEAIPGDLVQGAWTTVGATAEYRLGGGPGGKGHDITSVQSIAGWNSAGFGNQAWTLEVKAVGGEWRTLVQVDCQALESQPLTGGGASKVTLTREGGPLATGIEAIKVTADPVAGSVRNAFVWRELDVFGAPSAAATDGP